MNLSRLSLLAGAALLAACAENGTDEPARFSGEDITPGPGFALWEALTPYCGKAFSGELESARGSDEAFEEESVLIHVRQCEDSRMLIPLYVGDDHSRTWVLERHAWGVTLKHEHRDPDGSPQTVSNYGGLAAPPAEGTRLEFPVDDETLAMLPNSVGGFWTLAVEDDFLYYQVQREGQDEVFRLAFYLAEPVDTPDAPWGWEEIL